MIIIFLLACFLGMLSFIAIQAYNQPNLGRKALIHFGVVIVIIASLTLFISLNNNREVKFTHVTQHADYYGVMHFNKVAPIDYDIAQYDWRSWNWLRDGVVHLTITDENGNKIVTE